MRLSRTTAPAVEPVTLATASLHARVIDSAEDSIITMMIAAARQYAESYCRRSFITQGWRLSMDHFPGCELELPMGPVTAVTSIVYLDMAGTQQTISNPARPEYAIDLTDESSLIAPGFGYIWPIALPQVGAVQFNWTAGYGPAPANVPDGIRHWICMRVNTIFENREELAVLMERGSVSALPYVDCLLDPFTVHRA